MADQVNRKLNFYLQQKFERWLMNRREFITHTSIFGSSIFMGGCRPRSVQHEQWNAELAEHKIVSVEDLKLKYSWPRLVGRNSYMDVHGQHHTASVVRLATDKGHVGWGQLPNRSTVAPDLLMGKRVDELIRSDRGVLDARLHPYDMALHDLTGVILDKPVYQLMGAGGSKGTPVYSGMIYIDELNEGNQNKSIDIILENCQWDYDYGYRQLKVKIGRSGKWYPHDAGLSKDIEVVNEIHRAFHSKGVRLLVDANNMYSLEDTIAFLKGVKEVPLLWIEEPFHEDVELGRKLKDWMLSNGFPNTLYADGENKPQEDILMELCRSGHLDAYLRDIVGYGFSKWRNIMPQIKEMGVLASPHAWGSAMKTNATAHLASGLGNCVTIEGVTCMSEEIDFGNYVIRDGLLYVSDDPGFGMRILV